MKTQRLEFRYSFVPVKKNSYRTKYGGGMRKKDTVVEFEEQFEKFVQVARLKNMDGELAAARADPQRIGGIESYIVMVLGGKDRDGDGIQTTLWDCLQNCGVFKNDKDIVRWGGYKRYDKTLEEDHITIKLDII